ncbi:MAG TPA: NAD(P)-dependent oxidoreductase [Phototrophicaceae bacterium]|nr:NAD(P)-dependent oxidoreductase [Phototrophicaceae bacterium]
MAIRRVLVTGGSGKLGKFVIDDLQAHGYAVLNADRRPLDHVRTIEADLCNPGHVYAAMSGVDAVVHLAAIPHPLGNPPEVVFQTNVMSTFNILQAALTLGVKKIVLASSVSAVGTAFAFRPVDLQYLPIDEAHPLLSQDAYGLSKMVGEELAEGFARRDPALSLTSLRFTSIITPEEAPVMFAHLRESGESNAFWTYIDARDAAIATRLSIEYNPPGHRAFYINAPRTYMPQPTLDLLRRRYPNVQLKPDKLTGTTAPVDCSPARDLLGFEPQFLWDAG